VTLPQAKARIRNAWLAGIATALMTLFASVLPLFGASVDGFNLWNLTDFVLIAGLTVGIAMKSRACALIMLAYFVVSKALLVARTAEAADAVLGAIFAYLYFEGVRGTFAWRRMARAGSAQPPVLAP
jgi:hypothetical protein